MFKTSSETGDDMKPWSVTTAGKWVTISVWDKTVTFPANPPHSWTRIRSGNRTMKEFGLSFYQDFIKGISEEYQGGVQKPAHAQSHWSPERRPLHPSTGAKCWTLVPHYHSHFMQRSLHRNQTHTLLTIRKFFPRDGSSIKMLRVYNDSRLCVHSWYRV